jgi:tetratricopeptide (TPR) repeat protein
MGFPKAADMQGRFITEAFDVEPVTDEVDTYERGRRVKIQLSDEGEAEEINRARLEALGYVGPDQTISSNLNLASFLLTEGRYEEAIAEFEKAAKKQPSNARIWASMGEAYGILRNVRKAEEYLRMAKKLDPQMYKARVNLARLLLTTNRLEPAKRELEEVIELSPGMGMAWVELGRVHLKAKNVAKAEEAFRQAVRVEPEFTEGRIQLGLLLIRTRRLGEAEKLFRDVVELEPRNRVAWNNLGVVQLRVANVIRDPQNREEAFDKALATYDTIVERFPAYAKGYYNRAQIRVVRGQYSLAVKDLEKAIELEPDYDDAKAALKAIRAKPPR